MSIWLSNSPSFIFIAKQKPDSSLELFEYVCLEVAEFLIWRQQYNDAFTYLLLLTRQPLKISKEKLDSLLYICNAKLSSRQTTPQEITNVTVIFAQLLEAKKDKEVVDFLIEDTFREARSQIGWSHRISAEKHALLQDGSTDRLAQVLSACNILYLVIYGKIGIPKKKKISTG